MSNVKSFKVRAVWAIAESAYIRNRICTKSTSLNATRLYLLTIENRYQSVVPPTSASVLSGRLTAIGSTLPRW